MFFNLLSSLSISRFRKFFFVLPMTKNKKENAIKSNDIILSLFLCSGGEERKAEISMTIAKEATVSILSQSDNKFLQYISISASCSSFRDDDEWFSQTQVNDTKRCGWKSAENRDVFFVNFCFRVSTKFNVGGFVRGECQVGCSLFLKLTHWGFFLVN